MRTIRPFAALASAGILASALAGGAAAPAAADTVRGNQACGEGQIAYKLDRAPVEGETVGDGTIVITITDVLTMRDDGGVRGFTADVTGATVEQVWVKAGPYSVSYTASGGTGGYFHSAMNANSGKHYEISNVLWCYTV